MIEYDFSSEMVEREFTLDNGPFDGVKLRLPSILRVIVLQDTHNGGLFHRYEWVPGKQIGRSAIPIAKQYKAFVRLTYMGPTKKP